MIYILWKYLCKLLYLFVHWLINYVLKAYNYFNKGILFINLLSFFIPQITNTKYCKSFLDAFVIFLINPLYVFQLCAKQEKSTTNKSFFFT